MSTLSFGSLWSNLINSLSLCSRCMHARPAGVGKGNTMMMMTGRVNVRLRSARSLARSFELTSCIINWVPEVDVIGKDKKKLWRK